MSYPEQNGVMRWLIVAFALSLTVLTAGCGSGSPTQAQIRAEVKWFSENEALSLEAVGPPLQPWVNQDPATLTPAQCRNLATASTKGLATAPMPIASLEALWRSYLQELGKASADCIGGHRSAEVDQMRQARGTLARLTKLANRLPAEFHQLPTG